MRRSRLELCESILEAALSKPLSYERLAYNTSIDCTVLERHLNFLIENSLIEERPTEKKTLYAITERGVAVLKALNFQKYLGKIKSKLRAIDEAMEVIPQISRHNDDFAKKTTY